MSDDAKRAAVPEQARRRSADAIEADLGATREHLAQTLDALADRMRPRQIVSRAANRAKLVVVSPDGRFRTKRVIVTLVVAGSVAAGLIMLRRLVQGSPPRGGMTRHGRRGR
ncbi:MAG TPA: DUF3618 domain-containing protein [Actinopolymorphaceae bacterium]|jgi:hypothetical protein